jgi:SPP1 gp7 family putative phage head morphogenesis protein
MAEQAPQALVNDAVRRQVLLEGVKANEADKFAKFLKQLEKEIRQKILQEGETIRNRTRLKALLSDVRAIEKEVFDEWLDELNEDLVDIADTEADLEIRALTATIEEFDAVKPAPQQLLTAFAQNSLSLRGKGQGLTLKPFLTQYTTDQVALIEGIISQGFAEGTTTPEIVRNLKGTKANKFKDGVLAKVDKNTKTMVRTAVQNASAQARQATWQANSDVISRIEWISTLDGRTTVQCRSLDGQTFPLNKGPRPPIHYNCRSTTAPVPAPEVEFLKKGAKRGARSETASGKVKIGQVKQDTTYYAWLKKQPAQFQDKVLGGTRGKLLRDGGLTADEFAALQLNKQFEPLTLDEMAEEAKAAFDAAGLLDADGKVIRVRKNVQPK